MRIKLTHEFNDFDRRAIALGDSRVGGGKRRAKRTEIAQWLGKLIENALEQQRKRLRDREANPDPAQLKFDDLAKEKD